ncbi:MAG: dihydroorotate dehydrogenase electron transfer subunit [Clostridia bacterium]|nr:dihydroorotate dehydrogenase electron transfer subunit [Clostridia bacterium]
MLDSIFTLKESRKIAKNTYEWVMEGDTSHITAPGQFVNIKLDGFYLRRPISVADVEGNNLTIVYKVVGEGTEKMANMPVGSELLVLSGLGNGYDLAPSGDAPLLIGGGAGVPPMFLLARRLTTLGKSVSVILGFGSADEIFYKDKFEKLGAEVYVTTADGSEGVKGFVTDAMPEISYSYFYTCGPEPMLKAVYDGSSASGQFSFEERMGCGFGACMGCTCETKYGNKRICRDGPVLVKEEIIW